MTTPVPAPIPQSPATLRYDPISHMHWLEFDGRPEADTIAALKRDGWRWSGYRKQWYTNRRFALPPACVVYEDGGECDYASERADRLSTRADCHRERATDAYERSNAAVAMIPLGQPILVGHHSERGHRAALARSHRAMDKSVQEGKTADRLAYAAKSSASHQARKQTPEAMQRRVDRLSAEHRAMLRHLAEMDRRTPGISIRAEYQRRADMVAAEIAELEQAIKDAGGIQADKLAAQGIVAEVGDLVQISSFVGIVKRVNRKTYTVDVSRDIGRDPEWMLKLDRTHLHKVIAKAAELQQNRKQQQEQQEKKQEQGEEPGK